MYNNRSWLAPNASIYVESNQVVFSGNDSGASGVQRNAGVYFSSISSLNATYNGSIRFTLTLTQINNNAVGAWGLMPIGWSGCGAGGVWLELQTNRRLDIVNGGSVACTNYTTITSNDSLAHTYQINTYRIGTETYFSVFRDGVLIKVVEQSVQALLYANFSGGAHGGIFEYRLSGLYFTTGNESTLITLPLGSYCGQDSTVCASGYCEYTKCALKMSNALCYSDSECASGDCDLTGHCTDPGLMGTLTQAKSSLIGSDSASSNFLCIIIILAIGAFLGAAGITAGNILIGLGASFTWMFLSTIFFVVVGWLSPFFLIALVLVAVILFSISALIGSGGGVN